MAAPKGMWECPNCGDFVYNASVRCPNCGSAPGKETTSTSYKPAMSSQAACIFAPDLPQCDDSSTPGLWTNIGKKIEMLAIFGFILAVIASFVCAIVFGRTVDRYADTTFNFWLFLLILVSDIVGSYLGSMFIFAFGRLVNNSQCTAEYNKATAQYMEMQLRKEAEKKA